MERAKKAGSGEAVKYIDALVAGTLNKSMDEWTATPKAEMNAAATTREVNKVFAAQLRNVRKLMAKQVKNISEIDKQTREYLGKTEPHTENEARLCLGVVELIPERRRELDDMRRNLKKVLEKMAAERRAALKAQVR